MDENKNLEPETAAAQPSETAPAAETDSAEISKSLHPASAGGAEALEDALPAEEAGPEDDADDGPPVDMVFGLRRRTFHLVVVGYALGIIVVALLGLAGIYPEDAGTVFPGIIGAALGYALAWYLDKRDAEKESGQN